MEVVVTDVNKTNFAELLPVISKSINEARFIALDTELSGIGSRKDLMAPSIEDRFSSLAKASVAATRSILSLGVSCFIPGSASDARSVAYLVYTFNITTFCDEDYVVEPGALRFLIAHGFDFNKQVAEGVPYKRGNDSPASSPVRQLFRSILDAKKPIVLHNAFVDLVFLYQQFYAQLPASFQAFVADLTLMFSAGVLDTKFVAEFHRREPSSFLEYLFRKWQRLSERQRKAQGAHGRFVELAFPAAHGHVDRIRLPRVRTHPVTSRIAVAPCEKFAGHGVCKHGMQCPQSHDLDVILDHEELRHARKRKKHAAKDGQKGEARDEAEAGSEDEGAPAVWPVPNNGHRAGFDSFMTGFCAAQSMAQEGEAAILELRDRVYLSAKPFPLLLAKSKFAAYSAGNKEAAARDTAHDTAAQDKV